METTFRCGRCGGRLPVTAEMVGQVVLCPQCLERVYVTEPSEESVNPGLAAPSLPPAMPPPSLAADILGRARRAMTPSTESPVGLAAVFATVALLVLAGIGVLLMRSGSSPSEEDRRTSKVPVPPLPPPVAISPPASALSPDPKSLTFTPFDQVNPALAGANNPAPPAPVEPQPATETPRVSPTPGSSAPVGRWAEVWPLPPVHVREPVVLTSLEETTSPMVFTARAADVDPRRIGPNVLAEKENSSEAWQLVRWTPGVPNPMREPLARIWRAERELLFAWLAPAISPVGPEQLANCVFEFQVGAQRRVGQVRVPQRLEPLLLDLSVPQQTVAMSFTHPPRPDQVCLEVTSLEDFPSGAMLRGGTRITMPSLPGGAGNFPVVPAPLPARLPTGGTPMGALPPPLGGMGTAAVTRGVPLVIELSEVPGLEIRLGLVWAAPEKLELTVQPVYRDLAGEEFPFTRSELDRRLEESKRSLSNAQAGLVKARLALKRLEEREEKLSKNKATAKRDLELAETKRLIQTNKAEEARLSKQVDAANQLEKIAESLRMMIQSLDKRARIEYVVYLEAGETDLLLATTSKP